MNETNFVGSEIFFNKKSLAIIDPIIYLNSMHVHSVLDKKLYYLKNSLRSVETGELNIETFYSDDQSSR